jgi:hypothetical protein
MPYYFGNVEVGPSCLLLCIWREGNAKSFEDCETTMLDLKKMFQSLYTWILAFNSLSVSNITGFLEFCPLSIL